PPRYYAELIEQIISQLEMFFASHLEDMFLQADNYLFEAADEATSTAEQTSLFECMNSMRASKQLIQQGFVDELSIYLQPVGELDELPEKKQSRKSEELGLVEQNEMDEMVTLVTISSKAAMDNAEAINHLIKRFKELSQYNDHIFHAEALEPKRLCDSMYEAVREIDLTDKNKLILYRFFDRSLVSQLAELYETLNNLLIEQGILPVIDYSGAVPHYEESAYEEPAADMPGDIADPQYAQQPAQPLPPGASAAPPPPPGMRRAFGSGMAGYSSYAGNVQPQMPGTGMPMQSPDQQSGQPAGGAGGSPQGGGLPGTRRAFGSGMVGFAQAPAPASAAGKPVAGGVSAGMPAMGPSGQKYSAGVPVGQVRESIENFVGGTHADGMTGGAGYYSHRQVMTALTELQVPAENISETPLAFDANQIKKAVLSSIGESEGGAVTKAVNQVSEKTIDFIKLIFDAIIDEESITDEIKTLLLSLQIPVIKAAMLDSDFFVDDQHPARQLLDKIAEAGVGVVEHTDPVYIEIEKVVRKLLNDYDEDVIAFTVALDELNELTEEIYRKARETEVESQKAVKMAHAKRIVLQEIRKITIGKELPRGIRTLVLKVWPSMMFNHFLNNGKANDEWVELLMILQKIIESVQPIHSIRELEDLGLSHQDIVDATRSKLKMCRKQRDIVEQALVELEETYKNLMQTVDLKTDDQGAAVQDGCEAQAEPVGKPTAAAEEDEQQDEELTLDQTEAQAEPEREAETDAEEIARGKIRKLPEGVSPGAWFIVYNGEDRPVRRLKLAVILVHDATIVFVDHLGNVVIEKDAAEFTDEVEKGLSGIIMQHSVFDHALSSALETIEH
ncbi:hypothetical protein MNBD_GAMMA11-3111, partial [hydrothermal vent metagenome]